MVSAPFDQQRKQADRRKLWTVSELAQSFGLTSQGLRFYEQRGLISPRRKDGARVYDYRDRARLVMIQKFRRLGFSLDEIADYLSHYRSGANNAQQHRDGIAKIDRRLADLARLRAELDDTIAELSRMRAEENQRLEQAIAQEAKND
ncbi:MerR family transcriptional regulator [Acetobacteraceae bacterium H6797]|nr:MerR family transcriptional regulator [Acetobacteraceae bacterium H6797]